MSHMNPNSQLTVYAMVGPMGSGKTTMALKIEKVQNALFQSLDGTIKNLNQPIGDLKGYERLMPIALDIMYAKVEIYHFEISNEERWRRVQRRNHEKPENVYHFTMSKEEFEAQNSHRQLPPPMPGLKVIKITD